MQIQEASRKKAKIKLALQGPSGSGKTYSALLIAYGLCKDWSKIVVVDTENQSADLYAHLGRYYVLNLEAPFTPEKYIEALFLCINAGMEVIIIDSISHEWQTILDLHGNMSGNSFTNWTKITPKHNEFLQAILQANVHIIATMRSKQDYVLVEKNGKQVPEKVGLKAISREGTDYEFTLVFELNLHHQATATKDRTSLFMGNSSFVPTEAIGAQIAQWCNEGIVDFTARINACKSVDELIVLYQQSPEYQDQYAQYFTNKKNQLQTIPFTQPLKSPSYAFRDRSLDYLEQ